MNIFTNLFGSSSSGQGQQQTQGQGQTGQGQQQQQAVQPGQTQVQQQVGQQVQQVQQQVGVNGGTVDHVAVGTNTSQSGSPLDNYLAIWQNANTAEGAQKTNVLETDVVPLGAEQMQALHQKMSTVNFLGGVNPEVITAALGGDANAFSSVINQAVQQALLQSVRLNGAMLNNSFRSRTAAIMEAVPQHVQQAMTISQIRQDNPIFNNPAARGILSALETNLATNHPNISPQQASQVAQRFLQDFATELVGKPVDPQASTSAAPGAIDWSSAFK